MKKLLIGITALTISTSSMAHGWTAVPFVFGVITGGAIASSANARPVVVVQQSVYPNTFYQQQYPYGYNIGPIAPPQPVYQESVEWVPGCACYQTIIRQIGWR